MFWKVIQPLRRIVNIFCVVLLAGTYVFTYYDYLRTVTTVDTVIVSGDSPTYSNQHIGVITVTQQISQ